MNQWIFRCLPIAALSISIPGHAWCGDVRFADAIRNVSDGGIVAEAGPGDVLVFDGGVFNTEGRPLTILADAIRIDDTTLILSHALESVPPPIDGRAGQGPNGRGGSSWGCRNETINLPFIGNQTIKVCNLEGEPGKKGDTGASGTAGSVGAPIEIAFEEMTGEASLFVVGNGQKGGRGQQGGQGGLGGRGTNGQNRAGDALCNRQNKRLDGARGGDGGQGGTGGQGGDGGRGSSIVLDAPDESNITTNTATDAAEVYKLLSLVIDGSYIEEAVPAFHVISLGGRGGDGGPKGPPGPPGQGGDAGGRSHCGGGGNPGAPGARGPEGSAGPAGGFGPTGEIVVVSDEG